MGGEPNKVARALVEAVGRFGPELASDPERLRALLSDLVMVETTDDRRSLELVLDAARAGVATEMVRTRTRPPDGEQRLMSAMGLGVAEAGWALDAWAAALGLPPRPTDDRSPHRPPEPPPEDQGWSSTEQVRRRSGGRPLPLVLIGALGAVVLVALVAVGAVALLGGDDGGSDPVDPSGNGGNGTGTSVPEEPEGDTYRTENLALFVPEGWSVEEKTDQESVTITSPDEQANIIFTAEDAAGMSSSEYASYNTGLIEDEFAGYEQLASDGPTEVFGRDDGYVVRYTWDPEDGDRVYQEQQYWVDEDRDLAFVATATATSIGDLHDLTEVSRELRVRD
ncbi:MAG: DUF1795 domain-containing protein [Acidimicrobiales bacterium]|jgi:hypothetical protein|nr:DUF1795 domain-containing protein [Acidimicrobiales bacterium]